MTETAPPTGVSAAIFNDAGEVLLVERGKPPYEGAWSLPGGGIEDGETIVEAAIREVAEETGLRFEPLGIGTRLAVAERSLVVLVGKAAGEVRSASDARAVRWQGLPFPEALPTTPSLEAIVALLVTRLAEGRLEPLP